MGIDDRDYMRDRNRVTSLESRRFQTSEQEKTRKAEALKKRFAQYSAASGGVAATKARWTRFLLFSLALVVGVTLVMRLPDISSRYFFKSEAANFPNTGAVRWFVPGPAKDDGAPLTIKGLTEVDRNVVVQLDSWESHAPIAMIPIRSGETATLQVPLGRYRIRYAANANWQGEFKLLGDAQEGIEPLEFYRTGNQLMGHRIDLNGRINGNLKTRRTSFF